MNNRETINPWIRQLCWSIVRIGACVSCFTVDIWIETKRHSGEIVST
jgi:hypothetical protein